ncbi:D(2) dopamine receptor-like [Exaiptasia diaphana]|uniref:G-protein coupled receptors family 1 profile domain-containing protein n=1 Tax=Exaiptasia diaphana TaxID=2652724 RepID=A0A913Y0X1_EXADI|nr:D(2) dopamine receptor-like [Exaiptasia diaphana]
MNASNHENTSECTMELVPGAPFFAINVLLALVGTIGNLLIIFAVLYTHQLRQKSSNFLLLSLAVADLLVTAGSQPLFAAWMGMLTFSHRCHSELVLVFSIIAPFSGSSSVLHLAAISLDRAIFALKPRRHHPIMKKGVKVLVAVCWIIAAILTCLLVPFPPVRIAVLGLFAVCFIIMLCSYGLILYKIAKSSSTVLPSNETQEMSLEKRVSATIAIIILLFLICWAPFFVYLPSAGQVSPNKDIHFWWIGTLYMSNSSMNFVVYSLGMRHFRAAYVAIFRKIKRGLCNCCSNDDDRDGATKEGTEGTYVSTL